MVHGARNGLVDAGSSGLEGWLTRVAPQCLGGPGRPAGLERADATSIHGFAGLESVGAD